MRGKPDRSILDCGSLPFYSLGTFLNSHKAGAGGDIPAGTGRGRGKKGVPSPGPGIGGSFNLTAGKPVRRAVKTFYNR